MQDTAIAELLAENRWMVMQGDIADGYGRDTLVRYIPGILRKDLPDVLAWVKTNHTTLTDPKTTPEGTWTGSWTRGRISYRPARDGEPGKSHEGTYNLIEVLHYGSTPESAIVTENGCKYLVTQTWYFAVPSIVTVPAGSSGISYTMTSPVKSEDTGAWTYAIEKREEITQTIAEYTSEREAFEYQQRTQIHGVRTGDKDNLGAAITLPDMATQTAGIIVDLERTKKENCTQDIEIKKRNAVAVSNAEQSKEIRLTETITGNVDKNQANPTALPSTQTAGSIVTVKPILNEFGKYNNATETRTATAVDDQQTSKTVSKFETAEEALDRNQAAAATPPSQTNGVIATVESVQNEFAKHDIKTTTRTALAVSNAEQSKEIRLTETIVAVVDRNQENAATLPTTQTAGSIVEVRPKLNDFGRYDNSTQTRTATAVDDQQTSTTASKFETVSEAMDRNQASAGTPPSQTDGVIATVESVKNEFAKHDVKTTTRTALAVLSAEQSKEIRLSETITNVTNRNQETAATLPTSQTAGSIVEVRPKLNEFGRYDNATQTRAATAVNDFESSKVYDGAQTSEVTRKRNQTAIEALPTALVDGVITKVVNVHNDYDRFDTSKEVETAHKQQYSYSWAGRYGTCYAWWGNNVTADELAAVIQTANLTAATNNHPSIQMNRFNLYSYYIEKLPYAPGGNGVGEHTGSGKRKDYETTQMWSDDLKRSVRVKREVISTFSWTVETTRSDALAAISLITPTIPLTGSRIEPAGGMFLAIRVTDIDDSADWELDENGQPDL